MRSKARVVVAGGDDDGTLLQLRRAGIETVGVDGIEQAVAAASSGAALTIVLAEPYAVVAHARRIHEADCDVPIILAARREHHAELDAAVRVDPLVGRATRCVPREPLGVLVEAVRESAQREARRRSHAHMLRHIAHVQLPAALAQPAAATQYLGELLEHATIGVVTVDPAGTITGWNPKAEAITGRRQRDAVGTLISGLFPPTEAAALRALLDRAAQSADALTEVFVRRGPAGDDQQLELTVASVDDGEGALGTLVLLNDVTDRVRTERELATRARNAALAGDVGVALTTDQPIAVQLQRCAQAVVDHLDAAFARIWTLDRSGEVLALRASAGMYTNLDGEHSRVRVGQLKIGRIAETRRPHLTNDVQRDPHIGDPEWARREGMVAFAGYPLVVGERLVGVLALFSRTPLPDVTLDSLSSIADTVAVGIEQAENRQRVIELLHSEQRAREDAELALERYVSLARTLQQSLLPPRLPDIPGLDLAARYHWAGAGDVVGGDFYDLFRLADGRVCIVIGDVSGKGVEAAAVSALARHTVRAAAHVTPDPVSLLRMLNEIVLEQTGGDRFCTVLLVTIAWTGSRLPRVSVTNAGHVMPLLVRPDGSIEEAGRPGLPVGLFDETATTECEACVGPGDVLVLFTDGVTDARSPTGEFQPGLVYDVLRRHAAADARTIASELEEAVVRVQAGQPRDDVAIVAIRFTT